MHFINDLYALMLPGGIWSTGAIVHLATLGYVAGFVLTNQFALRFLVLASSFVYVAYYYLHPEVPLWGAIFGTFLIIAATVIGLIRLMYDRVWITLPRDQKEIFYALPGLQPGEFRRLMKLAKIIRVEDGDVLTRQGEANEALFFLVSSTAKVQKSGASFTIPPKHFVGEVGFVLDAPASATVTAQKGVYVRWDSDRLRKALPLQPGLERALQALMGIDMANKVALGVPIEHATSAGQDPSEVLQIQPHLA